MDEIPSERSAMRNEEPEYLTSKGRESLCSWNGIAHCRQTMFPGGFTIKKIFE